MPGRLAPISASSPEPWHGEIVISRHSIVRVVEAALERFGGPCNDGTPATAYTETGALASSPMVESF
jgi:hypothetical protein